MVPVPVDFNELSDVVKMIHLVKNDVYDESVKKFNAIDTSGLKKNRL